MEATGAANFLALDDLPVQCEGERIDPLSIIRLPFEGTRPVFPAFDRNAADPFLRQLTASGKKWAVVTDTFDQPRYVVNVHSFLRAAIFREGDFDPVAMCLRPLIVRDGRLPIGQVLGRLKVSPKTPEDDVIDKDVIIVWTPQEHRIITGSDILGRLLRQIVQNTHIPDNLPDADQNAEHHDKPARS